MVVYNLKMMMFQKSYKQYCLPTVEIKNYNVGEVKETVLDFQKE